MNDALDCITVSCLHCLNPPALGRRSTNSLKRVIPWPRLTQKVAQKFEVRSPPTEPTNPRPSTNEQSHLRGLRWSGSLRPALALLSSGATNPLVLHPEYLNLLFLLPTSGVHFKTPQLSILYERSKNENR